MWYSNISRCLNCSSWGVHWTDWRKCFSLGGGSDKGRSPPEDTEEGWILRASNTCDKAARKYSENNDTGQADVEPHNLEIYYENELVTKSITRNGTACGALDEPDSHDSYRSHDHDASPLEPRRSILVNRGHVPRTTVVTTQPGPVQMHRPDIDDEHTSHRSGSGSSHDSSSIQPEFTVKPISTSAKRPESWDSSLTASTKTKLFQTYSNAGYSSVDGHKLSERLHKQSEGSSKNPREAEPRDSALQQSSKTKLVKKRSSLSTFMDRMTGNAPQAAKYEFQSVGQAKVYLRSDSTVNKIVGRKIPTVAKIIQYNFGFITINYKCSKEKKLEIDVLKVDRLPQYNSAIFGEDNDFVLSSLNYVDVEVLFKSTSGKVKSKKLKKFRAGDVRVDDEAFEPECIFQNKEMLGSIVTITVGRKDNFTSPHLVLGHAIFPLTKTEVFNTSVTTKTFPLRQGMQNQDLKSSVRLSLACSHTTNKCVDLSVNILTLHHVDVSLIGINHATPEFKVKPEIKIKINLLGSTTSRSTKKEFSWLPLQNNSTTSIPQDSVGYSRSFGGWGTMFPGGCFCSRTVAVEELMQFSVCVLIQVMGRNNTEQATKKEVVLGEVVLGPELLDCEGDLTHWGQVISKRASVEAVHRLHL